MKGLTAWLAASGLCVIQAVADDGVFDEYRDMLGDDNPAVFVVEEGADYWREPQGPEAVSLERCDLGLGPGVVAGAYAQLPRYFADAGRVMDLEARLAHCMTSLQGRSGEEIHRKPYSARGDMGTEMEALGAWIAEQSAGLPISPPQAHPAEREMYALGEQLFVYRAGPHDFSCATCHRQTGKRIRLQALPNLTTAAGAGEAYGSWPAYRISQGVVRTMGWRMRDCARQQRLPLLEMGSEASIALQTYLAVTATGAPMNAPGLKR
jgi:sulfur-oxidizing protein SoxA